MLIIEAVPLAIAEGLDTGIIVATCSTPRMDHDGEQLKGQQTLRLQKMQLKKKKNKLVSSTCRTVVHNAKVIQYN